MCKEKDVASVQEEECIVGFKEKQCVVNVQGDGIDSGIFCTVGGRSTTTLHRPLKYDKK